MIGFITAMPAEAYGQDRGPKDPFIETDRIISVAFDSLLSIYPALYEDMEYREADSLWSWLDHENPAVRHQAWRGLVHAEVSDIYQLELEAEDADHPAAWLALSHHELNGDLRRILEQQWRKGKRSRSGISRVLGKQGDQQSLDFLLSNLDRVRGTDDEFSAALAIGRLSGRFAVSNGGQFALIRSAFTASDVNITRAYLYGAYRSDTTVFNPEVKQNLYRLWQVYGIGEAPRLDQYMVKILGKSFPQITMRPFAEKSADSIQVRLGIELATLVGNASTDSTSLALAGNLLFHDNPLVVSNTLRSLRDPSIVGGSLRGIVTDSLLYDYTLPDRLWAEVVQTATERWPGGLDSGKETLARLDSLRGRNPYLQPIYLDILNRIDTQRYFSAVDRLLQANHNPSNTFAARSLAEYWNLMSDSARTDSLYDAVRPLMYRALDSGDRGTVCEIVPLLADSVLFPADRFNRIEQALTAFKLPADVEVYQAVGRVMQERFPERGRPLIDSLATLGYAPLNQTLRSAGWSLESVKGSADTDSPEFRQPDWSRLAELGPDPIWRLRTRRDTIRIRLDPARAPMTVSAIDSLTRAGAYDGVAIHRVVPNFVIQGGDIERGDGFGGPDFTLLTEPSEIHYRRGSVGIASAGTDTEGSQYFIMHQWKPHLNGNYSRFGSVVDGMEAVDRILVGDRILEAEME